MEGFTKKQSRLYLAGGGSHCPSCGGDQIETAGPFEADSGTAWQEVECERCHERWHDVYHLHAVYRLDGRGHPLDTVEVP